MVIQQLFSLSRAQTTGKRKEVQVQKLGEGDCWRDPQADEGCVSPVEVSRVRVRGSHKDFAH